MMQLEICFLFFRNIFFLTVKTCQLVQNCFSNELCYDIQTGLRVLLPRWRWPYQFYGVKGQSHWFSSSVLHHTSISGKKKSHIHLWLCLASSLKNVNLCWSVKGRHCKHMTFHGPDMRRVCQKGFQLFFFLNSLKPHQLKYLSDCFSSHFKSNLNAVLFRLEIYCTTTLPVCCQTNSFFFFL